MSEVGPGAEFRRLQELEVQHRRTSPVKPPQPSAPASSPYAIHRSKQQPTRRPTAPTRNNNTTSTTNTRSSTSSSKPQSSSGPGVASTSTASARVVPVAAPTRESAQRTTRPAPTQATPISANTGSSATSTPVPLAHSAEVPRTRSSTTDLIISGLRSGQFASNTSNPTTATTTLPSQEQIVSRKSSGSKPLRQTASSSKSAVSRQTSSTSVSSSKPTPRPVSRGTSIQSSGRKTTVPRTKSSAQVGTPRPTVPSKPLKAAAPLPHEETASKPPQQVLPLPKKPVPVAHKEPQQQMPPTLARPSTNYSNMSGPAGYAAAMGDDHKTVYYGQIDFGGDHRARYIAPHASADPGTEEFLFWLLDFWDLNVPKLIISVTGGANDWYSAKNNECLLPNSGLPRYPPYPEPSPETENDRRVLESRFKQLFSRGIARAALTANAWIIDGGSNTGVMRLCGMACADTKGLGKLGISEQLPTIGIATLRKVHEHEKLKMMGGTVSMREVKGGVPNKCQLDKYHDHFILVNTDEEEWGLEVKFRTEFEEALCSIVPSVLIVANGGANTANNVLEAIRQGRPVIVIKGSGRFADDLTDLYEQEEERRAQLVAKSLERKKEDGGYKPKRTNKVTPGQKKEKARTKGKGRPATASGTGNADGAGGPVGTKTLNSKDLPPLHSKKEPEGIFSAVTPHFLSRLGEMIGMSVDDEVVMASEERHLLERKDFVQHEDYRLAEIVSDGDLHFFDINEDPLEYMESQIVRSLFKKPSSQDKRNKIDDDLLAYAWKQYAIYDYNAQRQKKVNQWMMYLIICLNVISTILAVLQVQLRDLEDIFIKDSDPDKAFRYTIIGIPVLVGILIGASNRFNAHSKWLTLRGAAERIKREIYRYRCRIAEYSSGHPNSPPRSTTFAEALADIEKRVADSDVSDSALLFPEDWDLPDIEFDPHVSVYGEHPMDNRYSVQMPEDYFKYRLEHEIEYFRDKTPRIERKLRTYQWLIYVLSGGAAILGALKVEIWIAVTTSLVAAFTTIMEMQALSKRLTKYNRAITELVEVQRWWRGLLDVEKAGPLNVTALIEGTEAILDSEMSSWMQQMREAQAKAKKELSGEGDDDEGEGPDGKKKKKALDVSIFTNPKKLKKHAKELAHRPLPALNYPLRGSGGNAHEQILAQGVAGIGNMLDQGVGALGGLFDQGQDAGNTALGQGLAQLNGLMGGAQSAATGYQNQAQGAVNGAIAQGQNVAGQAQHAGRQAAGQAQHAGRQAAGQAQQAGRQAQRQAQQTGRQAAGQVQAAGQAVNNAGRVVDDALGP